MRRHCLSRPTWRLNFVAECNSSVPFARYASIRTVSESTLFGGSVHIMRSVLIRALRGAAIFPAVFLEDGPSSQLRTHLTLDPKRIRATTAVAVLRHFGAASPLWASNVHLLFG